MSAVTVVAALLALALLARIYLGPSCTCGHRERFHAKRIGIDWNKGTTEVNARYCRCLNCSNFRRAL